MILLALVYRRTGTVLSLRIWQSCATLMGVSKGMKSSDSGKSDLASSELLFCAEELVLMSLAEMLNRSHGEANPDDFGVDVQLPKEELEVEHRLMGLLPLLTVRSMIGEDASDRTQKCLVDASVMETKPLVLGNLKCFFSGWSGGAGCRLVGEMYLVIGDWVRSITLFRFGGLPWGTLGQAFSLFIMGVFGCSSFTLCGVVDAFDISFTFVRMSDNFRSTCLFLGCKLDVLGYSSFLE